jgi:hypothetical protein
MGMHWNETQSGSLEAQDVNPILCHLRENPGKRKKRDREWRELRGEHVVLPIFTASTASTLSSNEIDDADGDEMTCQPSPFSSPLLLCIVVVLF